MYFREAAKFVLSLCAMSMIMGLDSQQPADERKEQENLPKITSGIWQILAKNKVHFDEETGIYNVDFTKETQALDKTEVTVEGFIVPLEPSDKFSHFLISPRTPTCYYCPPGGPTEIIDVVTSEPISWDGYSITVKGTFGFMKYVELGEFFKLDNASIIK